MCNKCVIPLALFTFDTVDREGAEGGELRILNVDLGESEAEVLCHPTFMAFRL